MKCVLSTLAGIMICMGSMAQAESERHPFFENDSVSVFSRQIRCTDIQEGIDQDFVVVEILNKSQVALNIQLDPLIDYDGLNATHIASEENHLSLTLAAGKTISGTCASSQLRYFKEDHLGWIKSKLTRIDFSNISVTTVN